MYIPVSPSLEEDCTLYTFFLHFAFFHLAFPGNYSLSVHSYFSFFLTAAQYSIMWMYHSLFSFLYLDIRLFANVSFANNAVMINITQCVRSTYLWRVNS